MQIKCRKSKVDSEMVEILQDFHRRTHLYAIAHEDLFWDPTDSYAATSMLQRMNRGETITLNVEMVEED